MSQQFVFQATAEHEPGNDLVAARRAFREEIGYAVEEALKDGGPFERWWLQRERTY